MSGKQAACQDVKRAAAFAVCLSTEDHCPCHSLLINLGGDWAVAAHAFNLSLLCELEASLIYTVSSRISWIAQRNPIVKKLFFF